MKLLSKAILDMEETQIARQLNIVVSRMISILDTKAPDDMKELDAACEAAMAQIKNKRNDEAMRDEGRCDILAYGIAFCMKQCRVVGEKL